MLIDFVAQKFRQSTEGVACPCTLQSGTSLEVRLEAWDDFTSEGWNHLAACSLPCLVPGMG